MRSRRKSAGRPRRPAEARLRRQIVLLSILLHVLFLSFWEGAIRLNLFPVLPVAAPPPGAPLVFDLQQPELPREVIATPDDARTARRPQKADFLSDKNALARNQEPAPQLAMKDDPFSRGDMASHDLLPQPPSPKKEEAARTESEPAPKEKSLEAPNPLPGEDNPLAAPPRTSESADLAKTPFHLKLPGVPHRQMDARAAEEGGLSFNTYDWDFAPYMLALKERISRNIFPPLAFTKLGMIDGDTLLRFRIYPDGRLGELELLGYTGHHSLMETSRFAVTASAPFPVLPADFPKSYLEVTAKFSYFVKK
jgi:hypothetical protein